MANMRPISKNTLLKVVILGDGGVGKSCLMNRFVSNQFDENNFHTIGVEFLNKDIQVNNDKYTLQIWDTAGQERFRALRTPFYRGSDICILSYSIDDKESFKALVQWRDEFLKYADIDGKCYPFIVVGNKNDVDLPKRQVSYDELVTWCNENYITSFIETSAKTSNNVNEAFVLAVRQWKTFEKTAERELCTHGDIIDLTKREQLPLLTKTCCISNALNYSNNKNNINNYNNKIQDD